MRALVEGYEIEKSGEEKIKAEYVYVKDEPSYSTYVAGMLYVLKNLNRMDILEEKDA